MSFYFCRNEFLGYWVLCIIFDEVLVFCFFVGNGVYDFIYQDCKGIGGVIVGYGVCVMCVFEVVFDYVYCFWSFVSFGGELYDYCVYVVDGGVLF